jgi:hypothetical protein
MCQFLKMSWSTERMQQILSICYRSVGRCFSWADVYDRDLLVALTRDWLAYVPDSHWHWIVVLQLWKMTHIICSEDLWMVRKSTWYHYDFCPHQVNTSEFVSRSFVVTYIRYLTHQLASPHLRSQTIWNQMPCLLIQRTLFVSQSFVPVSSSIHQNPY